MALFTLKIWDKHETVRFDTESSEWITVPHPDDEEWHKFTYVIETNRVRIDTFQEYVIFSPDLAPQRCIKVFFSDAAYVYARYSLEAWTKYYNETYVPLVPETLEEIVNNLEGKDPE